MKKYFFIIVGLAAIGALTLFFFLHLSPQHTANDFDTKAVLRDFESDDWRKRDEALHLVLSDPKLFVDKVIAKKVIKLLEEENRAFKEEKKQFQSRGGMPSEDGEARGEYHIDLLDTVSKLKNPATIPLFIDALEYGPGVVKALSTFGDKAISPLLERCHSGDEHERWWCLDALLLFYNQTSSEKFKEEIKETIVNATKDNSDWVRRNAVNILEKLK